MIEVITPHGRGHIVGQYPDGKYLVSLPAEAPVDEAHQGFEYHGASSRFGVYEEDELERSK